MSAKRRGTASTPARPPGRRPAASLSPLPPPEEVFVDWLLSVPHDADLGEAARRQVALIDGCVELHHDAQRLRLMLIAIGGAGAQGQPPKSL